MAEDSAQTVLQRLLRKAGDTAISAEVTPVRVVRLSMARAAQTSIGLHASVLGVTEEIMPFDDVLALVDAEMMLLALERDAIPMGFAAIDLQLRTTSVELQTIGIKSENPAPERSITDADAALCGPLVTEFLEDLARTSTDTPIEGWADSYSAGARFPSTRAISMTLEDRPMRLVRLQLDLGGNQRQGEMLVALPAGAKPQPVQSNQRKAGRFDEQMRETVMAAPTNLTAVLHRFRLPLKEIRSFEVGQVVSLPGVTVGSVRLESQDGSKVADARLGQATGLRALRIERPAGPAMSEVGLDGDLAAPGGDPFAAGGVPMVEGPDPMAAGFDGMGDVGAMGPGGDGLPPLDAPGGLPDLPAPDLPEPDMMAPDMMAAPGMADGLPDEPADALTSDLSGEMPDFGAAPMGEGEFGFPALADQPPPE